MHTKRLTAADSALARRTFAVMAGVFGETPSELSEAYLAQLLRRETFWAFAALDGDAVIGGITAHTLPMTRLEASEIFLYDLAVLESHQRKGVGRSLVDTLRASAAAEGIDVVFVPADDEDGHALDFYRALGGEPASVTIFTFDAKPA